MKQNIAAVRATSNAIAYSARSFLFGQYRVTNSLARNLFFIYRKAWRYTVRLIQHMSSEKEDPLFIKLTGHTGLRQHLKCALNVLRQDAKAFVEL